MILARKLAVIFMGAGLATASTAEAANKHYGAICYGRGASSDIGGYDNKVYAFGIDFRVNELGDVTNFSLVGQPTPELRVIEPICNKYAKHYCSMSFRNSSLVFQATSLMRGSFSASIINGNYAGSTYQENKRTGRYERSLWGNATCQIGEVRPKR